MSADWFAALAAFREKYMRRSGRLFIVLGAGLALVAIGLVAVVLLSGGGDGDDDTTVEGTAAPEEPQEITVIVAARDVPAHTVLTQEDITEETVLSNEVPEDVMRNSIEAVGFAYSVDLVAGQPLVESNRELPGLANRIDPGRRAYPLIVDGSNLVAGQIRDDDHVDIIFSTRVNLLRVNPTYPLELNDELTLESVTDEEGQSAVVLPEYGSPPEGPTYPYQGEPGSRFWLSDVVDGDPIGKTILQNVRVLRVVTATTGVEGETPAESDGSYLILDLDPVEAELVRFLVETGTFQVVLRNPDDEEVVQTPGMTMNSLVDNWGMVVPKTVRLPEAGAQ
jgi:Flp pilus assembly protein CpaB